ncbi:MAG: TIGR03086 family metal-binding protein [Streptosporangiaceae bacterium]
MTNAPDSPVTDRRPALVAAYEHAANVVDGARPDQLAGPTPCPDYDVAALVDHLVGAGWRAVALGRGETPAGAGEFPHVELADAAGQLRKAGAEAAAAWSDDRLEATTTMPWGETYTGHILVDMYLSELVAHAWDLAMATGQTPTCDQNLAVAALAGAQAMLRPEYRDMMGVGNPFGAEQPVPEGATTLERFAAFMGRHLDWRS